MEDNNMNYNQNDCFLNVLLEKIEVEVIRVRVAYLLEWYEKKSKKCKRRFLMFSILAFTTPLFATLLSTIPCDINGYKNLLISISTLISSISTGVVSILRDYEGWIRYSDALENIKTELVKYVYQVELVESGNHVEQDKQFLLLIEQIAQDEKNKWVTIRKNDKTFIK